jgi:signal peptidase I
VLRVISTRRRVAGLSLVLLMVSGCGLAGRQTFTVPSESMEPTIKKGSKVTARSTGGDYVPRRGDIIVYRAPAGWTHLTPGQTYISRVIGVPGDALECCDGSEGPIVVNGEPLHEPYVHPGSSPSALSFSIRVPQDRLWFMGDHRDVSIDSRSARGNLGGGTIAATDVVAVVEPPA